MGDNAAHAKLSPSSLYRVKECPGSFQLYTQYPPKPWESPYAIEGTKAHEVGEVALRTNQEVEAITEDEDMIYHVGRYVEYCLEVAERNNDPEPMIETKLDLSSFIPLSFGTADFISVDYKDKGWIDVIDLKYGKGVHVVAEDNHQLVAYGIGAAIAVFGEQLNGFLGLRMHIFQPRRENFDTWELGAFHVMLLREDIRKYTHDAWNGKLEFKEGSHCGFCEVKKICPIKVNKATNKFLFELMPQESEVLGHMENESQVKEFYVACRKAIMARIKAGEEIPGYELAHKRGKRQWVGDVSQGELVSLLMRSAPCLEEDSLYNKKLKSPTQVELVLKKAGVSREEYAPLLEQLVYIKEGELELKRKRIEEKA